MSYDAADYKRQVSDNAARRKQKLPALPYHPIATFVLYYGVDREWRSPMSGYRRGRDVADAMSKPLIHVQETLEMVTALTGDSRYERAYKEDGEMLPTLAEYLRQNEIKVAALAEARAGARGEARGIIRSGRKYGATEAQIKADLIEHLNMTGADADRAMHDFGSM